MRKTGENVAEEFHISRGIRDLFAMEASSAPLKRSETEEIKQEHGGSAIQQKKGDPLIFFRR